MTSTSGPGFDNFNIRSNYYGNRSLGGNPNEADESLLLNDEQTASQDDTASDENEAPPNQDDLLLSTASPHTYLRDSLNLEARVSHYLRPEMLEKYGAKVERWQRNLDNFMENEVPGHEALVARSITPSRAFRQQAADTLSDLWMREIENDG